MIEDDILLSDLLATVLRTRMKAPKLQVFSTGKAGMDHCFAHPPDLLIVDLGLPDMGGRRIIESLRARLPELRVIVLTGEFHSNLPGELLSLGATGFVHKTSSFEEMEEAIRRVLANGIYFSSGSRLANSISQSGGGAIEGPSPTKLTAREREIARLVATGQISKEIAAQLNLSPRTVEKARSQILAKLGLRDLPSLVRWCMQHGLI